MRILKPFLLGLGAASLLTGGVYSAGLAWAASRERSVDRTLGEYSPRLQEVRMALEGRHENATALALKVRCDRVGLPLGPARREQMEEETDWSRVSAFLHDYLERQLENPRREIERPPPEVSRFMSAARGELEEICVLLLSLEPPVWESRPGRRMARAAPHNLGVVSLDEWLMVQALSEYAGDREAALRHLEAAWVLSESFSQRPEIQGQITAMALARAHAGAVRKLDGLPPAWRERLSILPCGDGLRLAFLAEALRYREWGRSVARLSIYKSQARRERILWRTFGRVWMRLAFAGTALQHLDALKEFERAGTCEEGEPGLWPGPIPRAPWPSLYGGSGPDLRNSWRRLAHLRQDIEISRKILDLDAMRAANGGSWPLTHLYTEQGECPRNRWSYEVASDGTATLLLKSGQEREERRGAIDLPLRFQAGGRKGSSGEATDGASAASVDETREGGPLAS